jgi:hypothetical protein
MKRHQIFIRVATGTFALFATPFSLASSTVYPENDCTLVRHTSAPPPFDETALSGDVDKLVYVGERFRTNFSKLKQKGWTVFMDDAGFVDRENQEIHVQKAASDLVLTSGLSHEVGHALYKSAWNYSTKEAYLTEACRDEGHALYDNVISRRVIQGCPAEAGGGPDIGIQASQPWDIYTDMVDNSGTQPLDYAKLGMLFCENNINSRTKQSYLEYYGDWYDQNFPGGAKSLGVSAVSGSSFNMAGDTFWKQIEALSEAAWKGSDTLVSAWPSNDLHEDSGSTSYGRNSQPVRFRGGRYSLGNVAISESTIATRPDGAISHASFRVEGVCIRRQDIESRYPDLVLTSVPPYPGMPYAFSTFRSWGRIGFSFNDASNCLEAVYFHPDHSDDD